MPLLDMLGVPMNVNNYANILHPIRIVSNSETSYTAKLPEPKSIQPFTSLENWCKMINYSWSAEPRRLHHT